MPTHRVTETALFNTLQKREKLDGFEAAEVSSRVSLVVTEAWPILQNVSRAFPLYTLHDPEHSFRVAENIAKLIPPATLSQLNAIELSLLLYAAYLHDIGMASSQEEANAWVDSDAYSAFLSSHEEWARTLNVAQYAERESKVEESELVKGKKKSRATKQYDSVHNVKRIQDVMYTEYLRLTHATRSADFVVQRYGRDGKSDNKIQIGEVNYADDVALLCKSHWEDVKALKDERYRRDKYTNQFAVNIQYCAIILRLADLIDLDPERTPRVLLDFIRLELYSRGTTSHDPVETSKIKSAEEWNKHRHMRGWKITPEEIRIEAKCSHPVVQRGLREFCELIDNERRDCWQLVKNNTVEITDKYKFLLTAEVDPKYVTSDGSYIYSEFEFQLDYDRIVSMLMGTELWGNPLLAIRELLQNALDACAHRAALSKKIKMSYEPCITFRIMWNHDHHPHIIRKFHRHHHPVTLICKDNGTGMDKRIVENYLMRIGRSYYNSPEFQRQNLDLYPISQFGMGIMSCFMLTNAIQIHTQRIDENLATHDPLIVEIDSSERYVVMRNTKTQREGTEISMQLSDDVIADPFEDRHFRHHHPFMIVEGLDYVLRKMAVHLSIPIEISHGDNRHSITIEPGSYHFPDIDHSALPCIGSRFKEFLFDFSYEETGGLAGKFRFLLPLDDRGNPCLGCITKPVFKFFVDGDGDLLLTTSNYKEGPSFTGLKGEDDDEKIEFGTDDARGVYKVTYGTRPPASKETWGDDNPQILEVVESHFRWSQDGLLVDDIDEPWGEKEKSEPDVEVHPHRGVSRDLFALFKVPGLNAADIDLRDQWRVRLNVQRTRFILGRESVQNFSRRIYPLATEMWKRITTQLLDSHTKKSVERMLCELYEASNYEFRQVLTSDLGDSAKSATVFAKRFMVETSQGKTAKSKQKKTSSPRSTRQDKGRK